MAEAFGRAMAERGKDTPASKVVGESKTLKDLNKIGSKSQANPEQRAYLEGHENGGPDNYYAAKERGGDYEKRIDELEDENSDAALAANRQKEWDDAFKSAKERVKRGYGDSYPEDMAEEGADAFEKQLWDVIDELKAQGRSVEDILGALKSMGQK
jgi:hypothetical protein